MLKQLQTNTTVLAVILIGIIALLPVPALAIADPDTIVINDVWAYQHCIETGDQLYVVDFKVDYAANPTENITQAYLARLMNVGAELASVAPYAYYDDGYARGVVAIYFTAATAPVWNNGYHIDLVGNPTLAWGGAAHSAAYTITNWSASASVALTKQELSLKILWLAAQLEVDWSIDMVESASGGGSQLTSLGEGYFTSVIPNLIDMTPLIFSVQVYTPTFPTKTYAQAYAAWLAADVVGTPLDLSDLGTAFGVSTMWVSGLLYSIACVVLLILVGRGTGSSKATVPLIIPCVIIGALIGVLPLQAAIIMGFLALVITLWSLFGSKASV
jgi:hypothetical protein